MASVDTRNKFFRRLPYQGGFTVLNDCFNQWLRIAPEEIGVDDIENMDFWEEGRIMTYPEMMPCAFDITVERWMYRKSFLGEAIGRLQTGFFQSRKVMDGELYGILVDPARSGSPKWNLRKLNWNVLELTRLKEKLVLSIEPWPQVKEVMRMKFK